MLLPLPLFAQNIGSKRLTDLLFTPKLSQSPALQVAHKLRRTSQPFNRLPGICRHTWSMHTKPPRQLSFDPELVEGPTTPVSST